MFVITLSSLLRTSLLSILGHLKFSSAVRYVLITLMKKEVINFPLLAFE